MNHHQKEVRTQGDHSHHNHTSTDQKDININMIKGEKISRERIKNIRKSKKENNKNKNNIEIGKDSN